MISFFRNAALATMLATAPLASVADSLSGSYLAARQAEDQKDYAAAARYFTRALVLEPGNPDLMEALVLAQLMQGNFRLAVPVAETMEARGLQSQVAQMVIGTELARQGKFDELVNRAAGDTHGIGPLVDGLVSAWALVGQGEIAMALDAFDDLASQQGLAGFALYHKGLALALVGDFEGAEEVLSGDAQNVIQMTRRGAMARAEILSQIGRNEDALTSLVNAFGSDTDPGIAALRTALVGDDRVPPDF